MKCSGLIVQKCLSNFALSLVCGLLNVEGISTVNIVLCHKDSTELQIYESHFLSSCQYSHSVACRFFELHDTLLCGFCV